MAIKPSYVNSNTLKKVTIGGSIYFLKDEDLRTLVESFGNVVYKDVETTFNEDSVNIATSAATAKYIKDQIAGISCAMRFMGVVERSAEVPEQSDLDAIAAHYAAKQETPVSGDVVIIKDNAKEYIYSGTAWEEVGDQNIYLTIARAAELYVPKTLTVAGIALDKDLSAEALSGELALNLKGLSHKDSATGTVEVPTGVNNITVAKAGEYTVGGTTVEVPASFNAMDVTPAGSVELTAGVAAAASYQKTSSVTISSASTEAEGNYTPAGSVSLPTINTSVSLSEEAVDTVTDKGTAYSISGGSVNKAEDVKAKLVKKGVSFSMDEVEECLNLSYVEDTSNSEFYTDAVTASGSVSYTAPTLSGSLPTFGTKNVAAATGATATTTPDGIASFKGTPTQLSTSINYADEAASVTQPTYTAKFTGTTKNVTPAAATTVNAQAPSGTITVGTEEKQITLTTESKSITVR